MKNLFRTGLVLAAFSCLGAVADVVLDSVFTSNMVLQRGKTIAFFGKGDAGKTVKAVFAGKEASAAVDAKGGWRVEFPAMEADHVNYTATFSDGGAVVELKDLILGDVWFCSGQSNMQMPVGNVFRRGWSAQNCEAEVAAANYPEMRSAFQNLASSHLVALPAQMKNGTWEKISPANAGYMSATAYFFGRKLHKDLNVPIGIINSSWGGTRIEPWISDEGYKASGLADENAKIAKFRMDAEAKRAYVEQYGKDFQAQMSDWSKLFYDLANATVEDSRTWSEVTYDHSGWKNIERNLNQPEVRWFRCSMLLDEKFTNQPLRLHIPAIAEAATIYVNGQKKAEWTLATLPQDRKAIINLEPIEKELHIAIRAAFLYGSRSNAGAGRLQNVTLVAGKNSAALKAGWKYKTECIVGRDKLKRNAPRYEIPYSNHQFPSNLYNAMVASWTKLPIKGVIWYQGCANAGSPRYYLLHKALIADWRARWNQPDLPFIVTQLAGYGPAYAKTWETCDPNDSFSYALTRDIQGQMLNIKNVGVACTIDIGEVSNIHPANKQDVGARLALEAERIAYGMNIVSEGPLFKEAKVEGNAIRVFFKNAEKGLKTSDGEAPHAFAIAGKDGKFVWTKDVAIEGNTVVVRAEAVKEPAFVRYAYAAFRGDCNLQNAEGLPAYPFRSDAYDYAAIK